MCTATSRGPQLQNLENLYRSEEPQKEEFRDFNIHFLIENNNYQQMHYTKFVKTHWNTTCVFLFFTKQQVSIIQNKKDIYASKRWFVKLIYCASGPGTIYQINKNK